MSGQLTKTHLRQQFLQERRSLSKAIWREKSSMICKNIENLRQFQEAKTILAYFSSRQEPDLSNLFLSYLPDKNLVTAEQLSPHKSSGLKGLEVRQWGFPRCQGQSLVWHRWQATNPLQKGSYGIPEPLPQAPSIPAAEVDLILVPALACDRSGYRLGYGGGFYDRMLSESEWANILKIGIVFDFAYLPQLPVDSWDRPVDAVCTDSRCEFF